MLTPINLNEQSDNVANLHAAMKALGLAVNAKEVAERRAGASTLELVRAFQQERKIRFDEKFLVDEPTAAVMNKVLNERGLLNPEPPDVNHNFIVKGTIATTNGDSVRDLLIVAFDQDLRSRQQLGTTRTNATGEYSIAYGAARFANGEKDSADLVIAVRSSGGETLLETNVLFNAPAVAEIDITLNGPASESEFARIKSEMDRLIDDKDLSFAKLEEDDQFKDVTFINGETGIEKEKIAHFIIAHKLAGRSKLDPEFWYAALQEHVFAGALTAAGGNALEQITDAVVAAVPFTNAAGIEIALQRALTENLIDAKLSRSVPRWLEQFRAFAASEALNPGGGKSPSELKQILDFSGLAETKQTKFAQHYVESGADRNEVIRRLRADRSFSATEIGDIEKNLVLNDLTFGSVPLIKMLGGRVRDAAAIRELAKTRREDWEKLLLPDPARPSIAVPDFVSGKNAEEKARNYAVLLSERFQSEYPTAAFAGGLERALGNKQTVPLKHAGQIVEFLNSHPEFELHATAVEPFIEKKAAARLFNSNDREGVTQELKALQRVFKLSPSFEATSTLLADGIHSAPQISRIGETRFVSKYAGKPGFSEAGARTAFQRAANTHAAVVTIVAELAAAKNANAVAALAQSNTALNKFPNLSNLFGAADICECEHCRSVYSPAAYFADVLMFLNARDSLTPGVSVKDVLFTRRPDLGFLELSCENSNTPLPYVDLACEILEDRITAWHLFDLPLSLETSLTTGLAGPSVISAFSNVTPSITLSNAATISDQIDNSYWVIRDANETYKVLRTTSQLEVSILRQTHNTAEELHANPEYVNEGAYTVLRNARYPSSLPFDLFTEELRAYLGKAGIKRAGLMEVFRGNTAPNNPADIDIAAEYFCIAKDEQSIIFSADAPNQFVYWGEPDNATAISEIAKVNIFLQKTGLEYNDLLKLLSLRFINDPAGSIQIVHLDSSCDTSQKRIQVVDDQVLDRLHRFLRLWQKLGWQMWEVDLVINNPLIGNGTIDDNFIKRLKPFAELKAKFSNLTIEQLCGFFDDLNTTPKFSESFKNPEPSLYEHLFLSKRLGQQIDPDFEVSAVKAASPTATLAAHLPAILAALKIREADMAVLLGLKRPANGPLYVPDNLLSLANISTLYRHAQLARLLKLKATEYQTLLYLADPFQSIHATREFVAIAERVRASGFNVDELSYLLSANVAGKTAPPEKNVTLFLNKLRAALKKIATEYDPSVLPNNASELTTILAALLQKLDRPPETIAALIEALTDQSVATVHVNLPASFEFPPAVTVTGGIRINYDPVKKHISFTGVMTNTISNTLLSDPGINALLLDPVNDPKGLIPIAYQDAIQTLFKTPRFLIRDELKFFKPPVFSVPLSKLPAEVNFAAQLPQALSDRIFFDTETGLLQFTGEMTPAEKLALKGLSLTPGDPVNINYEAAIETLSTSPVDPKDLWFKKPDMTALFNAPASIDVPNNLKSLITKAYNYLRPLLSEALVIQQLSDTLGISPAIVGKLVTSFNLFGTPTAHRLLEDFTDASFVGSLSVITLSDAAYKEKYDAFYWLHRVAVLIRKLKLSFKELEWIALYHPQANLLNIQTLPPSYDETIPALASLNTFLNLADYMRLQRRYSDQATSLFDVVEKLITDATYDNEKFGSDLKGLTGWNEPDVIYLTNAGVLDISYPADFVKIETWNRLANAVAMIEKLNGSAQSATPLAAAIVGQSESHAIKQMLRSKYEPDQWLAISSEIQDGLRERKLKSLVSYLLTQPMPADAPTQKWENANDLYAYYLIDVEMCSCQLTSRIVQASAAIQFFVQRCFMGLEPQVRVSAEEDDCWKQWKWMKNYRVWEANRKVFLYPENWIEPELRRDKSQFFKELENELLQNEVNNDNVETALLNYIDKLDGIAQLEIAGTFYEEDNHTLHVFARTPGSEPHSYYYRQWIDDRRWTPWARVECDIQGDYLIPVVIEQRRYLVWPEYTEHPDEVKNVRVPSAGDSSFQVQQPLKSMQIRLAISEYRNKKWTPKKVSKDFIDAGRHQGQTLDKSRYWLLPLDFTHLLNGKFLIFFYDKYPAIPDISTPPPQIFELLGCRGYPEKYLDAFNFLPDLTRFNRDQLRFMRNSEETISPGDALVPLNSRNLQATILEKTPGRFRINYPHYLSYFDKLFFGPSIDSPPTANQAKALFSAGTFYNWFYADKARTFFVRPQLLGNDGSAIFYKDLEAFVKEMLELVQAHEFDKWNDKLRKFYQANYQFRLLFQNFYHASTCLFARELYNHGVDGLMSRQTQFAGNTLDFRAVYGPMSVVNTNYPQEVVDFTTGGSYSQYNWELFFHAPLMIATRLSKNQRFEEAMQWFHYIFDPTGAHDRDPITGTLAPAPQKYWITNPFYLRTSQDYANQRIDNILQMLAGDPANPTDPAVKQELVHQVEDWRANPLDPHLIAQFRQVAYQKTTVMKYIDNLIAWGDQLFQQDTRESVNEAALLYVRAAEILGPRPRRVPPPQKPAVESFNEMEGRLDAFSNAIVNFENFIPVVSGTQAVGTNGYPLPNLLYFCIPQNDKLLSYWDTVADRLYKIRHCLNIEGVFRQLSLFAPPIDPGVLVKAVAAGVDISSALNDLNAPLPHYRYSVMLSKATEVTNDVKALGSALLSALEKKDAEALSLLRQKHEIEVLDAVTAVKEKQIEEAKENLEAARKSKIVAETRRNYYRDLERLSASERLHLDKLTESQKFQEIAQGIKLGASIISLLPALDAGASGFGGTPLIKFKIGGLELGQAASLASEVLSFLSLRAGNEASMASSKSTFERRSSEWGFQQRLAERELDQLDRQIAAAELRIAIAEKDLENHRLQIENSKAINEFMHSKYTNEELYNWMIGEVSRIYFQSYQLAYDLAKRAEKCFQYELGVENTSYIQFGYWDSLKKGLLSGEKLQYDLRRLDAAYIAQNRRELEITKHVSLALTNPMALLQFKESGSCFFDLPEELFDLDYQGHYFRRIKSVSISIPCVVGPYTTVNCTLRLIKNSTRINSQAGNQYEHNNDQGIFTDDPRFRESLSNITSIAASTAQNDSGMFELNFRDERYLPFEGTGAISTWKLELTGEKTLRRFDYESISDVIVHLRYTAREDAGQFKQSAIEHVTDVITEAASQLPLKRLFNLKHEFPTEWYAFFHPSTGSTNKLTLPLKQEYFPFFAQNRTIQIEAVSVVVKSQPKGNFSATLYPPIGSAGGDSLELTAPAGSALYVGTTHEIDVADFDESTSWSLDIKKGSSNPVTVGEIDIEEAFLIVEYSIAAAD